MAKRPRRRAAALESDYDEDEDDVPDDDQSAAHPSSRKRSSTSSLAMSAAQSGKNSERKQRRITQKTVRQNAGNRAVEHGEAPCNLQKKKKKRKTTVSGTRPLDLFSLPARANETPSNARPEKLSGRKDAVSSPVGENRLWVDKYSPRTIGDLAVHSKKVTEVKEWLEDQLREPSGSYAGSRVLLLTGPPGVGKTATVRVLAELMGVELLEWTTPAPEIWEEYSHHGAFGRPYTSKLDEFESFLERGRKLSSLPMISVTSTSEEVRPFSGDDRRGKGSKVLIIDDLPHTSDDVRRQRLVRVLGHLAVSQDIPAILVITDESGSGGSDRLQVDSGYGHRDIIESLERRGVKKIAFNPITVNVLKKTLGKVQLLENCRLSTEHLTRIAEASAGDLRQAMTSLQFFCLDDHLLWGLDGYHCSRDLQTSDTTSFQYAASKLSRSAVGGRDFSLSLFHALGKLLHNKRRSDESVLAGDAKSTELRTELRRQPLQMEEPEVILLQAHADSSTILGFLHENVLEFIDEDATEDVAAVAAYFSDADSLLGWRGSFHSRNMFINPDDVEPSLVATAAAGSVAARGVLFGNNHPAPRRWLSVRAPAFRQVERQARLKKSERNFRGVSGVLETEVFRGLMQSMESYPCAPELYRRSVSVAHDWSLTPPDGLETEDTSMQNGFQKDDDSELQFQPETVASSREGFEFEKNFLKMSVDDDIEDIEDPDE